MRKRHRRWAGPFTIDELLDRCAGDWRLAPPQEGGVYLVSQRPWAGQPSPECQPLYVGSNTGKKPRFRTRIGDLVADLFGFYCASTGHHSGGQSLHRWCREYGVSPRDLYIGWVRAACVKCEENRVYDRLKPCLNKRRPARCKRGGCSR